MSSIGCLFGRALVLLKIQDRVNFIKTLYKGVTELSLIYDPNKQSSCFWLIQFATKIMVYLESKISESKDIGDVEIPPGILSYNSYEDPLLENTVVLPMDFIWAYFVKIEYLSTDETNYSEIVFEKLKTSEYPAARQLLFNAELMKPNINCQYRNLPYLLIEISRATQENKRQRENNQEIWEVPKEEFNDSDFKLDSNEFFFTLLGALGRYVMRNEFNESILTDWVNNTNKPISEEIKKRFSTSISLIRGNKQHSN